MGNLSYEATESDRRRIQGHREVSSVEIIYNPRTHKSKGYAFVEMKKMEDAVRSVDILHNQPFMGRNLLVSGANERREIPAPRETREPQEEQVSMEEVKETSTPLLQPEASAPQAQEQ
ncbi:MAG: RNA recognition motif domain-containing protein [Akkermansia sp.]